MTKGLLWVGEAAYPLRNLARVYTVDVIPNRAKAWRQFWWRAGILFGLLLVVKQIDSMVAAILLINPGGLALVYFTIRLLIVIKSKDYYALAAETCGQSTAMVTAADRGHLRSLAFAITEAIDNPAAEFQMQVQAINFNPRHYHTGDNVNMYGGVGNTGVAK
ncbi:DUF6232 family protein [Streptomyces sp. NPDC060030]|uniref:DUF6232 family protein n=1 Tax=Streptomyces sp. NPDC060030 TaxID=3347042 RepID=UPI0036A203A0